MKTEYFLIGSLLWVLFPSLSLSAIRNKNRNASLIFVLVVASINATVVTANNASNYMQKYVKDATHINEVGSWIENHSSKNDIVMDVHPSFPYYSNRRSFWDYRLFTLHKDYLSECYKPKYIIGIST